MIDVDLLWKRVNQDIAGLGRSGYESNEEFNRAMNESQIKLYEKYHSIFEANQQIVDAVNHLIVVAPLNVTNGYTNLPSDYGHRVSIEVSEFVPSGGQVICENPSDATSDFKVHYSKSNQFKNDVSDPIQGVNAYPIGYYTIEGGKLRIAPLSISSVMFRYLKLPTDAQRVVTYDINDAEVYVQGSSIQLEWPISELPNFVSMMVGMKSISVRDPELFTYNNLPTKTD